jgi:hypothetical protein
MATIMPTNTLTVDDRAGNSFIIFDVHHTTGTDSNVIVPDSAVSVAHLPDVNPATAIAQGTTGSNTATVNPATGVMIIHNSTSGASGLGFTFAASDGVKQVIIDTDVATQTLKLVVRCIGNAAGSGSTGAASL